jgi:hypothetical protein
MGHPSPAAVNVGSGDAGIRTISGHSDYEVCLVG